MNSILSIYIVCPKIKRNPVKRFIIQKIIFSNDNFEKNTLVFIRKLKK